MKAICDEITPPEVFKPIKIEITLETEKELSSFFYYLNYLDAAPPKEFIPVITFLRSKLRPTNKVIKPTS